MNNLEIYVGSLNRTKVNAVKLALQELEHKGLRQFLGAQVTGLDAPSNVSPQPKTDEETIQGAINRCLELKKRHPQAMCIGLEGGVQRNQIGLFVCNWGALIDEHGQTYVSSGARVLLPPMVAAGIDEGKELSEMMELYAQKSNVRSHEGAVGILTEGLLDRSHMFAQVAVLLFGQKLHAGNHQL